MLFYRDDEGKVWKAKDGSIAGGEEIVLAASSDEDLRAWWGAQTVALSRGLRERSKTVLGGRGHVFAASSDQSAGFIDTLQSIDWNNDRALVFGTVSKSGTVPPADVGDEEVESGQ